MNPPSTPQIKEPPRVGVAADLPENRRGAAGFIAEDCGGESLFFCDGTAVDYPYDPIGNRISATQGSTLYDYDANSLNQYTTIDVRGEVDTPTYDDDGNLISQDLAVASGGGGAVSFTYNAENRLVAVDDGSTRTEFVYDYMGRRVAKDVYVGGSLEATTAFVYDGWNMVEEIGDADSEYYVWGLDLSQSLQGAGGVGGLIASVDGEANAYYFQFDANGNVGQLVDGSDGSIAARYEYDAFGQTIVAGGAEAADNPYRFSTKYTDESGLVYYGYRYYDPPTGRWLRQDPIAEKGGLNLYGFVRNNSITNFDLVGLRCLRVDMLSVSRRARIECDSCDTILDVAKLVPFDLREYNRWLKSEDNKPVPDSGFSSFGEKRRFSVPNTMYVTVGHHVGLEKYFHYPLDANAHLTAMAMRSVGRYSVVDTDLTADALKKYLGDPDIYGLIYFGHGPAFLVNRDSSSIDIGPHQSLEWLHHGLARLDHNGCSSAARDWSQLGYNHAAMVTVRGTYAAREGQRYMYTVIFTSGVRMRGTYHPGRQP